MRRSLILSAALLLPMTLPATASAQAHPTSHHPIPHHSAAPHYAATHHPGPFDSAPYVAAPREMRVDLDHTSVLRLPQAAAAIVVGNPDIADVSVHTTDTLLVVARSYGRTNIIAMDAVGRTILDTTVTVGARDADGRLQVFEGGSRSTYSCAPRCEAAPELGDDPGFAALNRPGAQAIVNAFTSPGGRMSPMAPDSPAMGQPMSQPMNPGMTQPAPLSPGGEAGGFPPGSFPNSDASGY